MFGVAILVLHFGLCFRDLKKCMHVDFGDWILGDAKALTQLLF